MSGKATFGLNENIASLCSYAGVFVSGIVFLIAEKDNKKVRFHALQSTVWFLVLSVLQTVVRMFVGWLPLIGWLATSVVGLFIFLSWLFLMYNAYKGNEFRIPILGDIVYDTVNK